MGLLPNIDKFRNNKVYAFTPFYGPHTPNIEPKNDLMEKLKNATNVIYIHSSARGPFSLARHSIENFLNNKGFYPFEVDYFLNVNKHFIKYHDSYRRKRINTQSDFKRIAIEYFSKSRKKYNNGLRK